MKHVKIPFEVLQLKPFQHYIQPFTDPLLISAGIRFVQFKVTRRLPMPGFSAWPLVGDWSDALCYTFLLCSRECLPHLSGAFSGAFFSPRSRSHAAKSQTRG
ncbi:MAG: hypothetical protein ACO1PN_10705 [Betaproteobacteria bacterium]